MSDTGTRTNVASALLAASRAGAQSLDDLRWAAAHLTARARHGAMPEVPIPMWCDHSAASCSITGASWRGAFYAAPRANRLTKAADGRMASFRAALQRRPHRRTSIEGAASRRPPSQGRRPGVSVPSQHKRIVDQKQRCIRAAPLDSLLSGATMRQKAEAVAMTELRVHQPAEATLDPLWGDLLLMPERELPILPIISVSPESDNRKPLLHRNLKQLRR